MLRSLMLNSLLVWIICLMTSEEVTDGAANVSNVDQVESTDRQKRDIDLFITNGKDEDMATAVALVRKDKNKKWVPFCSGSILTKAKILTARHCLEDSIIG